MSRFTCYRDVYGCARVFEKFKGGDKMSISMEDIIQNPCLLQPPSLPPKDTGLNLQRLESHRNNHAIWHTYVGECTNGTLSTAAASSTTERTTPIFSSTEIITDKITTKSVPSSTPIIPRTSQSASEGGSLLTILIPVLIVAVVAIVLAVLIYKFKSKIRKPSTGNSRNTQLYDLDHHDKVNYMNNKAERGEYWRGKDLDDVPDPGADPDKPPPQKVNKVKPIHIRPDNGTATYQQQHHKEYHKNGDTKQEHHGKLPNIPDRCPSKDANSNAENETIYANHQFEKLARANKIGHSNPTFKDDENVRSKPLPPLDTVPPTSNSTSHLYYIDDSPYDRVDFRNKLNPLPQIQQSNTKPVPTKRKRKPPNPEYDENAESVDV